MKAYKSALTCFLVRRTCSFTLRSFSNLHQRPITSAKIHFDFKTVVSSRLQHRHGYHLSMTPKSSSVLPLSKMLSSPIMGGDYAGLSANFCSETGKIIPVPDHLVPESMLEWGDVPCYLETLTSENESDGIERTTVTVLPEVGCGIDNLETTKKVHVYNTDNTQMQLIGSERERPAVAIDHSKSTHQMEIETIFSDEDEIVTDENGKTTKYPRRIRISFAVDLKTNSFSSDISMHVERPLSDESTRGTKWTGEAYNSGGLDARTVVTHIGKAIVYGNVFAVKNGDRWDVGEEDLIGKWIRTVILPENETTWQREVLREKSDFGFNSSDEHSGITAIQLPQNILLRFGHTLAPHVGNDTNQWGIELSRYEYYSGKLQRNAVLRLFDAQTNVVDGTQSISHYFWVEEKNI